MAPQTYSTIPAAAEEQPLSQKQAKSYKSILAGVAAVAFVLGVSAATAVTSSTAPKTTNFALESFDPACAAAKANFEKCTSNEQEVCEEPFRGFVYDPFRFDGTTTNIHDDMKKYQNCGEWYGSFGISEQSTLSTSDQCWQRKCDAEMKALAQCNNEVLLRNVYGIDCTCEINPLPEDSKDGKVLPPGVKACKPKPGFSGPPADICEAGTFCDIDCAEGYANFDRAKGCANAAKGYCCQDTKPVKYPFTPNTK